MGRIVAEEAETSSEQKPAKPDDLLAQLASDEVDRLLAEADVERAPAPEGEAPKVDEEEAAAITSMLEESAQKELEAKQAASTAAAAQPVAGAEAEAAAENAPAAPPGPSSAEAALAAASTESPAAEAPEELSAQLDQLFAALTTEKKDEGSAAPAAKSPGQAAVDVPKTGAAPAADDVEAAVATAEKEALGDEFEAMPELSSERVSWWVRPLQWINAPFDFLPENVKEKLGWVGVQTLIFAVLILAYVWWKKGK